MTGILTIDAGGTFFKSALVTEAGQIPGESRISLPVEPQGKAEDILKGYGELTRRQMETARRLGWQIQAIVVDTPGPFDYARGASLMRHKFPAIYGIPLSPWIAGETGKPVYFLHDSTAFLLGEHWRGKLKGNGNSAAVMLGTGLGFSCMKDGRVQLAPQGGPAYSLYNTPYRDSTAEEYVSRRGIRKRYFERVLEAPASTEVADIAGLAGRGDRAALETFWETGQMLGEILLPVLGKLESRRLVIGGQIAKAYPYFGAALEQELDILGLDGIGPSRNTDDAHLLGCVFAYVHGSRGNR